MLQSMNKILTLTYINPLKNKLHRFDSGDYWPTSIKETIQWFLFPTIMEHTENTMKKIMG